MRNQINLNPKAIEKSKKSMLDKVLICSYILVVVILFINAGIIYYKNKALEKDNLLIKSEVDNYKEVNYDYKNIVNDIKNKESLINKIKQLEKDISAWEYVDTLKKYFPQNMYLEDISFDSDGINMEGIADTKEEVSVFLANLQMSKIYKNAKLTSIEDVEITVDDNDGSSEVNNNDKVSNKKDLKEKEKVKFTISVEGVKKYEEK